MADGAAAGVAVPLRSPNVAPSLLPQLRAICVTGTCTPQRDCPTRSSRPPHFCHLCYHHHCKQEVLAGLADMSERVLLEFVEGADTNANGQPLPPGEGLASPARAASAMSSGSATTPGSGGDGSGANTPTARRRRAPTIPPTPLSASEAFEVAVAASAGDSESRDEWRLAGGLQGRQSAGSASLSLDPESSRPEVPAGRLAAALGSLSPRFFHSAHRRLGGSAAGRGKESVPASRQLSRSQSAHSAHSGGSGAADATADLELVIVEAPSESSLPRPGLPSFGSHAADAWAAAAGPPAAASSAAPAPPPGSPASTPPPSASPMPAGGHHSASTNPYKQLPPGTTPPHLALPPGAMALSQGGTPPRSSPFDGSTGAPSASPQPMPLKSASGPARVGRRIGVGASQAPDLPTVISQQVLMDADLPSLPPLFIPLGHQSSIAEDVGGFSTTTTGGTASPTSLTSPFGSADAQQAAAAAAAGQRPGTDEQAWGRPSGGVNMQRPSTSSTVFYAGTPREPAARTRRSRWLQERALGRSFVKGKRGRGVGVGEGGCCGGGRLVKDRVGACRSRELH